MHKIYGKRLTAIPAMHHSKTGRLVYDGKPETVPLGEWKDKNVAEMMAEHLRGQVDKEKWEIYVE